MGCAGVAGPAPGQLGRPNYGGQQPVWWWGSGPGRYRGGGGATGWPSASRNHGDRFGDRRIRQHHRYRGSAAAVAASPGLAARFNQHRHNRLPNRHCRGLPAGVRLRDRHPTLCGSARNLADHAAADHRQRPGSAVAHQRWGCGNFGRSAHRRLAAVPRSARQGGDRHRPGRAGSPVGVGRGSRQRAAVESHSGRIGLDDHICLPGRGDFVASSSPGMDPAG